jgi:hypothetical protein
MARKIYKLKHKPTGLYWTKSYGHISDKGSIYSTGINGLVGFSDKYPADLHTTDQKLILRHLDMFSRVGTLTKDEHFKQWNYKKQQYEEITFYRWSMKAVPGDYEKEFIGEDEPKVDITKMKFKLTFEASNEAVHKLYTEEIEVPVFDLMNLVKVGVDPTSKMAHDLSEKLVDKIFAESKIALEAHKNEPQSV